LLGQILVEQGAITDEQLRGVLVEQLGVPSVNVASFPRDASCLQTLPAELARKFMAVALYRTGARVAVAMENPVWWEALREMEAATGLKVDAAMAARQDLLAVMGHSHAPSGERPAVEAEPMTDNDRLRVLSARVLSIQEEERRHISRDLHDDVGQALTALKFALHRLTPMVTGDAAEILSACIGLSDTTLERVRQLAHDMRPPQLDELGMEEAVRWLVERQRAATGVDIKCHFNGLLDRRFPEAMESACYRITQEALSNAMRHAEARSILVSLEASAHLLRLTVRDDGKGFDAARKALPACGLGLISMSERANLAGGHLNVGSEAGQGTMVRAVFPLEPTAGLA
jgi:signal transduction histidine kinase